jgi:hypothetical protein
MPRNVLSHIQRAGLPTQGLEAAGPGTFLPAPTYTSTNRLLTAPSGVPYTAFGEIASAEKTPQIQQSFDTHIDPLNWDITTSGDATTAEGTVTLSGGQCCVSSNGAAGGSAQMETTDHAWYHPGQGLVMQFSGEWTDGGAADNVTLIGYGDATNGLFFGYNGAQFGVMLRSSQSGTVVDTWVPQPEWNGHKMLDTDANTTGVVLDPTKANVYIIRAQLHYHGSIHFYAMSPLEELPILLHTIRHNDQTNTGTTLLTASLPLHLSSTNATGATPTVVARSASLAVFIEGRERIGRRKFSYALSRAGVEAEEHILTLRMRDTITGRTNHGHALICAVNTGTTGNRPGFVRVYKNVKVFGTALTYGNHHLSSLLEQATNDTTLGATLTGTVGSVVGDPPTQFEVAGVDGTANRLAGCVVHVNGTARRIVSSSGSSPATLVVAGMDAPAAAYDGQTATIYNGEHIFTQAMGKDSSTTNLFDQHMLVVLNRGDSLTITAESSASAEMWVSLSWIEKQ